MHPPCPLHRNRCIVPPLRILCLRLVLLRIRVHNHDVLLWYSKRCVFVFKDVATVEAPGQSNDSMVVRIARLARTYVMRASIGAQASMAPPPSPRPRMAKKEVPSVIRVYIGYAKQTYPLCAVYIGEIRVDFYHTRRTMITYVCTQKSVRASVQFTAKREVSFIRIPWRFKKVQKGIVYRISNSSVKSDEYFFTFSFANNMSVTSSGT